MTTRSKLLVAAIGMGCFISLPVAANESTQGNDESQRQGVTETRVLIQGDSNYRVKQKMMPGVVISSPFISEIHYPENWDWASKGSILDTGVSLFDEDGVAGSKAIIGAGPNPPGTTPPIGTKENTGASCYPRRSHGGIVEYGSMAWHWEYGYRVDSDGDGKKDSDPGWYLTKEEFTPYQETQSNPILC